MFNELDIKIRSHIPLSESEFDTLDENIKHVIVMMAKQLHKHDSYEGPCTICEEMSPTAKFSGKHRKCNKCRNATRPRNKKTDIQEENKILLAAIKRLAVE
jgi:hypothetical protein